MPEKGRREGRGGAASSKLFVWPVGQTPARPFLRLSARGTRARGAAQQNGRWCCHQRPLCRASPARETFGRSGRRLRSQPRRLELRRLASRATTALLHRCHLVPSGPACHRCLTVRCRPSVQTVGWCRPSGLPVGPVGPRLLPFPSPGLLLSQAPRAAGWRSSRRAAALACGSGSRGCPPSPAACLPAFQPCQGAFSFRVCLPGFHQSGRARRPRCLGVTFRPFQFPAKPWNITRDRR